MMKLGAIDFSAFSGVCKSWRSFAVSNKNNFMASRPPMSISISPHGYENGCYLKDSEGRKFKTIIPHFVGRICIGMTSGYLILLCKKTRDFLLVNPISRNELHFPDVPSDDVPSDAFDYTIDKAILVFSHLIYGWVFGLLNRYDHKIWFYIAGRQEWTYIYTACYVHDLVAFKGKIYILDVNNCFHEVRLYPTPKVTSLNIESFPKPRFDHHPVFVSSGENLYVMEQYPNIPPGIHIINYGEMKCVLHEKTGEEYAFFHNNMSYDVVILPLESWADLCSQYKQYKQYRRYAFADESGKEKSFRALAWYFLHDCLKVNYID
ncbi:unnamed protein product [Lactuca virosa]|uniref:KIB1-4 beta-propeller domain-containing protein n=1 Tax=Lactuca virosa TaxID=75947 RepID=A0AAU9PKC7_9ASTR|nr:unnamed protein product [Lactuca virosa]